MSSSKLPPPKHISVFSEIRPPKPKWTAKDVPDLTGQVILVTGGSAGIGKETCRVLVSRNAKVYLAARSEDKARAVIESIRESTGKSDIHFLYLDLADLASVRKAADEFTSKEQQLHVLINNGGVSYFTGLGGLTAQQYDETFGVNALAHYFLTKLLMPTLLRTAKGEVSGTPCKVRVVTVSSNSHRISAPKEGIVWETLQKGDDALPARKKTAKGGKLYGQSKLANILISNEIARRYGDDGVVAISVHPGGVRTEISRNWSRLETWITDKLFFHSIEKGIITPLYAATSPEALDMNGEYLTAWARRMTPSKNARSPELAEKLWTWCEEQVAGF